MAKGYSSYVQEQKNQRLREMHCVMIDFDFWCLMPLSAIFQQYHGDQF
jgi:hypothetical protein